MLHHLQNFTILSMLINFKKLKMPNPEPSDLNSERPTLTQKRSSSISSGSSFPTSIPKIGAFDKPIRLQSNMEQPQRQASVPTGAVKLKKENDDAEKGSASRIVIWVIIVVALAVASYFALKNVLNSSPETGVEPTVVVTEDPLAVFVDKDQKLDSEADALADFDTFTDNTQNVGTASESQFSLSNLDVSFFTSFTRIAFSTEVLTGESTLPAVLAEYTKSGLNEISLTFSNTSLGADTTILNGKEMPINSKTVSSLTTSESTLVDGAIEFTVNLNYETAYLLHLSTSDNPVIYLDILEVEDTNVEPSTVVTGSPVVTTTVKTTTKPTFTPTNALGKTNETTFSIDPQELSDGLTNNSASAGLFNNGKSFNWADYSDAFRFYRAINKGDGGSKYPTVTAKYEGNVLIVEVSNLQARNVASPVQTFPGARDVQSLEASQSGNVLTFKFSVSSQKQFKLSFQEYLDSESLLIQIKH